MARTFRRHRATPAISELNVTNLIDLGFTLLIIFMIATPLIEQEQQNPVNLPVTSSVPAPIKDEFQSVSIDAKGNHFWGNQQITWPELQENLARVAALAKPPVISIRADRTLQYDRVMRLIDELQKHKLSRFSLTSQGGEARSR